MAGDVVIRAERIGKKYVIGHETGRERHETLRDVIARGAHNIWRKTTDMARGRGIVTGDTIEEFWALKDVTFEVARGEVVGIIGRNGAGKSTLLKVLSRITEPTEGRVSIGGRVASLLEVGTGFHPELTGRENIFLNGSVLGMTRREVRKRFDEIVTFADINKFLDTPVKHYSSGMYVRLAFAVAAHLEPEILIIDEVLAVGDAEFQKKCLGKMNDVSRAQGRTVLFVSHNLGAVSNLCSRVIHFDSGRIRSIGSTTSIVTDYLRARASSAAVINLEERKRGDGVLGNVRVSKLMSFQANAWSFDFRENVSFQLQVYSSDQLHKLEIGVAIYSYLGFELASWQSIPLPLRRGVNNYKIEFQELTLAPGQYSLGVGLACDQRTEDWMPDAATFEVTETQETGRLRVKGFNGAMLASARCVVLEGELAREDERGLRVQTGRF
jgi:lipopolysaccharide transport system ATP-binding protein